MHQSYATIVQIICKLLEVSKCTIYVDTPTHVLKYMYTLFAVNTFPSLEWPFLSLKKRSSTAQFVAERKRAPRECTACHYFLSQVVGRSPPPFGLHSIPLFLVVSLRSISRALQCQGPFLHSTLSLLSFSTLFQFRKLSETRLHLPYVASASPRLMFRSANGRDSFQLFVGVFDTCLVGYLLVLPSETHSVASMTSLRAIDGNTSL